MAEQEELLQNAVNVLGNPTDLNLVGTRSFVAEASPTGLPSAPAPDLAAAPDLAMEGGGPETTGSMLAPAAAGGGGGAGAGGALTETVGPGGPTNLQRALQALGLAQGTVKAASKLQNIPGREGNAFNLAQTGINDLGFTLGGGLGQGFVDTPIGALSQQDYQGMLEALRSGIEGPSPLLGQGGFTTGADLTFEALPQLAGAGGEAAEAGAGLGTGVGGGIASGAFAALPVIMAALRAAGVDIPEGVSHGVSTAGAVGGAALAPSALAGGIGLAAVPIMASILGETMHRMEPSEEWQTFGGRLAESLNLENAAANYLGQQLTTPGAIQDRQQLADLVGRYRQTLGGGPETFEEGTRSVNLGPEYQQYLAGLTDPFALPSLPGATGTPHEGRQDVDFSPLQGALDQIMAAYQQYLPAGEVTGGPYAPWTLQEIGLSRNPMFYNPFWNLQTPPTPGEQAGGE